MEVSESRISQLHRKALQKMKDSLGSNIDIFRLLDKRKGLNYGKSQWLFPIDC